MELRNYFAIKRAASFGKTKRTSNLAQDLCSAILKNAEQKIKKIYHHIRTRYVFVYSIQGASESMAYC